MNLIHGDSRRGKQTTEYVRWKAIKSRCLNPKNKSYRDYGGRGIKICERWVASFENFLKDMGRAPKGKQIDRINNNGDYCPENCKWSTRQEQGRNTRRNHTIEYGGELKTIDQWADFLGIKRTTFEYRVYSGWSVDRIFNEPIGFNSCLRIKNQKDYASHKS